MTTASRPLFLLAAALALHFPDDAWSQALQQKISDSERRDLEAGKVLTRFWREGNAGAGRAVGVVDASPEKVFQVIADVERYKEFMTRMVASRVLARRGNRYHFYYKIDMPWPLGDYWCVTENWHQSDPGRRRFVRRWTLVQGTFLRNEGSWEVSLWPGGRALLTYSSIILPRTSVPARVVNYGTKVALPRAIENLRRRVKQLQQGGRL